MKVIKIRFLIPSLVLAFLIIMLLGPVARADPIPFWRTNLDWGFFSIVSLSNYAINLCIVIVALWFVKRKINIKSIGKLAIIVLPVTLVGMTIWTVTMVLAAFVYVGVAEVLMLALLLRWSKLSTLGQGVLIGVAMIVIGFFAGLPLAIYMLA